MLIKFAAFKAQISRLRFISTFISYVACSTRRSLLSKKFTTAAAPRA